MTQLFSLAEIFCCETFLVFQSKKWIRIFQNGGFKPFGKGFFSFRREIDFIDSKLGLSRDETARKINGGQKQSMNKLSLCFLSPSSFVSVVSLLQIDPFLHFSQFFTPLALTFSVNNGQIPRMVTINSIVKVKNAFLTPKLLSSPSGVPLIFVNT